MPFPRLLWHSPGCWWRWEWTWGDAPKHLAALCAKPQHPQVLGDPQPQWAHGALGTAGLGRTGHWRWRKQTFVSGYVLHLHVPHLGHVAQHGEDDEAREEAGEAVHRAGDERVPGRQKAGKRPAAGPSCNTARPLSQPRTQTGGEMGRKAPAGPGALLGGAGEPHARATSRSGCSPVAVVVEVVVTGQSQKDAESGAQGEENLRSSIHPDLAGEMTLGWRPGRGPTALCYPPHSTGTGPMRVRDASCPWLLPLPRSSGCPGRRQQLSPGTHTATG